MAIIRNEEDFVRVIELVAAGEWNESEELRFEDYPRFEITLVGERFDGGCADKDYAGAA